MRRLARAEGGQAVIEFALALPILLLLILGLVQFGLLLNAKQQLEDTARQGARAFALSARLDPTFAAVRLTGRQIPGFDDRARVSVEVTRTTTRRQVVFQEVVRYEQRCTRVAFRQRRCTTVPVRTLVPVTQDVTGDEVALTADGSPLSAPAAVGLVRRGDWVAVTVTYQYPNPIAASAGGFRLPATVPLTARAVARMESGEAERDVR